MRQALQQRNLINASVKSIDPYQSVPLMSLKLLASLNFLCVKGPFLHYDLVSFLAIWILETCNVFLA